MRQTLIHPGNPQRLFVTIAAFFAPFLWSSELAPIVSFPYVIDVDFPFLKGCAVGLSIAAPVGPIGVLCIRRSLAEGARVGFMTGLGAAAADGFYGAVAAFGLTVISSFLTQQQTPLRV